MGLLLQAKGTKMKKDIYLDNIESTGYSGSGVYVGSPDSTYIGLDSAPIFEEGIVTPLDLSGHTEVTDYGGLQIVSRETNGNKPQYTSFDELINGVNFGSQTDRDLRTDPLPPTMVNVGDDTIPNLYNLVTNFIATTFSKNDLQCMFDNPYMDINIIYLSQVMSNTGLVVLSNGYTSIRGETDGNRAFLSGFHEQITALIDFGTEEYNSEVVGAISFTLDNDGQAASPFYRYDCAVARPIEKKMQAEMAKSMVKRVGEKLGKKLLFGKDISKFKTKTAPAPLGIEIPPNTKFPSWQMANFYFYFAEPTQDEFFPYAVKSACQNFVCNVNKNYDLKRGLNVFASTFGIQTL
jgi:hypothetical protein